MPNGYTQWPHGIAKKQEEVNKFQVFKVLAKGELPPLGYKRMSYSFVLDVKFDLRRKARIVASGHRTDPHGESYYFGVVPPQML